MMHLLLAALLSVNIADFKFAPASLTIHAGDSVRFVNHDQEAHTVTDAAHTFDSGGMDTGDSWTFRFVKAGVYRYFCALHPYMKGTIVVRARK